MSFLEIIRLNIIASIWNSISPDKINLYNTSNPQFNLLLTTLESVHIISTDGDMLMGHNDNQIYFIFMGSSSSKDWELNLLFCQDRYENDRNIFIHKGFLQQFKSLEENITTYMTTHNAEQTKETIFTGFSLGGALAQIAGFWYSNNPVFSPCSVISIAAPKSGNIDFIKACDEHFTTTRLVLVGDPVPTLPMGCCYVHTNKSVLYELPDDVQSSCCGGVLLEQKFHDLILYDKYFK